MIELGKKAKDKVTGFAGIITGRSQWITGCDQYCLVPEVQDGKIIDGQWFDEGRINVTGPGITEEEVTGPKRGGPVRDQAQAR